jgi:putative glutamine amidotransferase
VHYPLIGITAYSIDEAHWDIWSLPVHLLPARYAVSVRNAGGAPVLLPPGSDDPDGEARVVVSRLDALLLAGGTDVDPAMYGAARHPATEPARPQRDVWEAALIRAALDADVPVLGICRGMQILNVALGGTLIQHLPDVVGSSMHCPTIGQHARHTVTIGDDTQLAGLLGAGDVDISTYHHQAVDRLGAGLSQAAWASDGVVEAVEIPGKWVFGVQWHPESDGGGQLLKALVDAAGARV